MTGLAVRADRLHMATASIRRATNLRLGEATGGRGRVYDEAEAFRQRLLKGELQAVQLVIDHWRSIQTQIRDQVEELTKVWLDPNLDLDDMQARSLERLSSQDNRIRRLIGEYAARIEADLAGVLLQVGELGADQAATLIDLQLPAMSASAGIVFDRLPREAVEQMVAQTVEGPLRELLRKLAPEMVDDLARTLVDGVGLGLSPRETARRLAGLADMPRWRALNIARTETLRSYREANRRTLTRNRRIVKGWIWHAELDDRTCPVCWAMHGQLFPADATFATHPSCRCGQAPVTKTWAELGIDATDSPVLQIDPGIDLFATQPVHVQRSVLGPAKWQAYKDGLIDLPDLVGSRFDPTWGEVRFERPLKALIGDPS